MVLTEDSKTLLKYIKKKVKKTTNFKEYRELFEEFKKVCFSVKVHKIDNKNKENVTVSSPFISDDISESLKKLKKHKYVYFSTNDSHIHLNIYYYKDEKLRVFLNKIIEAICFLFNLSEHNVKECTINYYLVDNKKELQNKNYLIEHLTQKEVNSGSCSPGVINIWRKEEVLKVTIHEIIHLLDYDLKNIDTIVIEYYKKKYSVSSSNMNIYEAYTEIWANLINIYLIIKNQEQAKTLFAKYIEYEKFFVNYQACKIFYITGLTKQNIDIDRETNILPYYIIRNELFSNLKKFLNYCKKNNINYIKLQDNLNNYFLSTKNCESNDRLFKTKKDKDSFLYKTTRMSSIELELFSLPELHPPY